jgi:uncharacterized protein (DUF305 family)
MTSHISDMCRRTALGGLLLAAAPAAAQERDPSRRPEPGMEVFGLDSQEALNQINETLRRLADEIAREATGDLDADLAGKIIAFHQTSIDIAQVILAAAVDPRLRALASDSINQEANSIASIRTWMENRITEAPTQVR